MLLVGAVFYFVHIRNWDKKNSWFLVTYCPISTENSLCFYFYIKFTLIIFYIHWL
jgi:hypothetical protein